MFETLKMLWASRKAAVGAREIVVLAVAILLVGILLPIGLTQMQSYTPTDPTLLIVWPLLAIIIVIGLALKFLPSD